MKLKNIRIVCLKEILDTLRDRRTLVAMIVIPVLIFPVMMLGIGHFAVKEVKKEAKKMQETVVEMAVIGKENAPKLYQFLKDSPQLKIVEQTNHKEALSKEEIRVILDIPQEFELKVKEEKDAELTILFDGAKIQSATARKKLYQILKTYEEYVISKRLEDKSINQSILTPIEIKEQNIASKEKMGGMFLGMLLPYMVILLSLTGAMYPAIDLTAGEKERRTIETLLVSPATRLELILGKFLTVLTTSMITTILSLISMFVSLAIGGVSILSNMGLATSFSVHLVAV
ncbi:MAG: ABC transporter permease, partial [Planctomycetota bacterium]|nr:ABC transporter permease [Planctomycetota bacterium]